ncbi:hypothetical protein NM688_g4014 [Phlebia brevispora]|uniref:Uncharacterized protein n=1 Tax=Phlebia brevispora TaxID=194682 RepID=A0ACC1T4C0_9APHY|nr:hypothetical protein NM688_g4014 [Phlebia brevispora]
MTGRGQAEVLELEPLLVSTPDDQFFDEEVAEENMLLASGSRDLLGDAKDTVKVDQRPVSPSEPSLEERRLVRKIDTRILPVVCILYLFAYLDRSNLGNARLQGLPQDTLGGDPTGKLFDWVNSAFFFSYISCQVPATLLSKLFPPRLWLGGAAVGWGFDFGGLVVGRISLGVFEACFGPGIPLYLSLWYTKAEMGLRMAYWFGFAAVAGAFGGLIAFGVQQVSASIANWRLLFIIEGIPTVLLGIMTIFLLPDRPEETPFLNEEERSLQLERMNRGLTADVGRTVDKEHVKKAFKDWRIYVASMIYFGANCALASTSAFLPTIIKTFGFTNARAQLLTVPPYAVSAVYMCLTSYVSDRLQSRGLCVALSSAVGGIGYLLLLTVTKNEHVRYFATFCITSGTYTVIGVIIAWFAHNLGSETKKATGIAMYNAIGPRYIKGFAVSCALEFLGVVLAIILYVSYRIDNALRDRKYGKVKDTEATVETRDLADQVEHGDKTFERNDPTSQRTHPLNDIAMATDYSQAEPNVRQPEPHPYLHEPLLYISNLPPHVTDADLAIAFAQCAPFRPNIPRDEGSVLRSGTIEFRYLEKAEKALATLQGRPIPNIQPPVLLTLSPYPSTTPPTPPPATLRLAANRQTASCWLHRFTTV